MANSAKSVANTNAPTEADVSKLATEVMGAWARVRDAKGSDTIARFELGRILAHRPANITVKRLLETLVVSFDSERLDVSEGAMSKSEAVYRLYTGKVVIHAGSKPLTIPEMAEILKGRNRGVTALYAFAKVAKENPTQAFINAVEHGKPQAVKTDLVSLRVRQSTKQAAYKLAGTGPGVTDDDVVAFLVTRVAELTAELKAAQARADAITSRPAGTGKRNGKADKPGTAATA